MEPHGPSETWVEVHAITAEAACLPARMEWDAQSLQDLAPFSSQHRRETNVSGKTPRLTDPGDQLTVTRRLASMDPRPDARAEDVRVSLFSSGSTRLPKNVATGSLLSKTSQGQERTQLRTSHFPCPSPLTNIQDGEAMCCWRYVSTHSRGRPHLQTRQ